MSLDQLAARMTARGVRPTPQRLAVLAELAREPNDATAQVLWQRMRSGSSPSIGLATVYRTLALLRNRSVVDALPHGDELCYRLCGPGHQHHLVCRVCHRIVEIDDCDVGRWADRVARSHGFAAAEHEIEISGVCGTCSRDGVDDAASAIR
jgi:Fur family ferric uptake transcriptional regulator